jgi:prophage antirepressor-like protein
MEWENMGAGPSHYGHDKTGRAANGGRAKPRQPDRDVENSARFRDVASIQAAKNQIVATGSMEFDFGGHRVRAVLRGDEAWFAAADVCVALDHTNPRMAIGRLDDDEKGVTTVYTPGGPQEINVVSESGLFALILTSRKPEARAFRRWVTGEVLPSIRRTGGYSIASGNANTVTLSLREAARYIVMVVPGRPPHVRRTRYEAILGENTALDNEILCHALKSIECWWHKTEQIRSLGDEPTGGFAVDRLEHAVLDGGLLAEQILRPRREEES